ncbi:hypothetical protein THAOC_07697, partial [Thalassiosira oceanica]
GRRHGHLSSSRSGGGRESRSSGTRPRPLRVCCYGSSSSRTPARYTDAAYDLGSILARRGHTCVNGAGSSGCMAAMNSGASDSGGRIVGVIHEKFVVDGSDWLEGAHSVFGRGGAELLLATGNDLQERKRLLVRDADALVVLPGGPGTWDELWEMACAGHLGFHSMPIVCVNVDGYYDDFRNMLDKASKDGLLYSEPGAIVHFEDTPEEAVGWVEAQVGDGRITGDGPERRRELTRRRKRPAMERLGSSLSMSGPANVWGRMTSFLGGTLATTEARGRIPRAPRRGGWPGKAPASGRRRRDRRRDNVGLRRGRAGGRRGRCCSSRRAWEWEWSPGLH